MLLKDVIEDFLYYLKVTEKSTETQKSYKSDLYSFLAFLEKKYNCPAYIDEINLIDLEEYLFYLKNKNLKPASRSRNLYTLRSIFSYAYKNKLVKWNIANELEPIKLQHKERTFLSKDEVAELAHSIDHPLIHTVVDTLFYTGLRISECLNLKLSDVSFDTNLIHVINGKGGKDRDIPMSDNLVSILTNYLNTTRKNIDSEFFFATEKSGKLTAPYVNRVLNDTAKSLGWKKHISAHILRHSFASNLIKNGVNLVYVQKLLGHSNLKVTSIYTHANMDELSKSVNML